MHPYASRIAALTLSVAGAGALLVYEGSVPIVYYDVVNVPTVCVGHTATVSREDVGKRVAPGTCEDLLRQDLRVTEAAVKRCTTAQVTQAQYDSLVSLAFNIGPTAYCGSTLLRKLNAGDCLGAYREFARWNRAGGREVRGLTIRRAAEAKGFATGCAAPEH